MSETSKNYRASFVLDMRGRTESVDELIDQLKKDVEAVNGEVVDVDNIGSKDFARTPDRDLKSGIFVHIDFRSTGLPPSALHERLRLNKAVNRILVRGLD